MAKSTPRRKPAPSTAIVPAAPVAPIALPVEADPQLVEKAVEDLQAILRKTVSRGVEEVGTYLLDKFYGGSAEAYLRLSNA